MLRSVTPSRLFSTKWATDGRGIPTFGAVADVTNAPTRAAPRRTVREQYSVWPRWRSCGSRQLSVSASVDKREAVATAEWAGLRDWRAAGVNNRRHWGKRGPELQVAEVGSCRWEGDELPQSLAACGLKVLKTADPKEKIALTHHAWETYNLGALPVGAVSVIEMPDRPERPERPELVHPKKIPNPKQSPLPLNVYLLHTLAHIELNAIDLAWDTVARFSALGLPEAFYTDFAHVADDESRHLGWCLQRLEELGHAYGDMPAHDLLWEGAQLSSDDLSWRMCMVPMAQEARGLDAGPRLADKLCGFGDNRTSKIVMKIAEEEKAHVAVGVTWFNRVCSALQRPAQDSFRDTMGRLCPDLLTGFFNHEARQEVGLPQSWYDLSAWPAGEAELVCRSAGLDPHDPRKRCEPSTYKLSPPAKLDPQQLEMLSSRLLEVLDVELTGSQR